MSTSHHDARLDEEGSTLAYPDAYGTAWYVTDPSTGMTQLVTADAESTARWLAWSRWRGGPPADERDEVDYAALEVIRAGNGDEPAERTPQ